MPNSIHRLRVTLPTLACTVALCTISAGARADEGMWLPNAPPAKYLQDHYKFTPTAQWLEHIQKSSVRFETGGSGSIVSSDGLVMTNHHVGSDMLLKLSTPQHDLLKEGFWARERSQELACPDLELNVLWQIEDVTAQVTGAVKDGMSAADAGKARREAIAAIEKQSKDSTHLKSEVVTLYGGAKYHLYRYRSHTDIRLVFAPEEDIAFFGGDTDNFEFPRYDLDCCFFRIYENGKPLKPEHHLSWSPSGAAENELVLVSGHPGKTERLNTLQHLKISRDVELPRRLGELWRREIKAMTFGGRSAENARIVRDEYFGVANSRKALTGQLDGLQDPGLIATKKVLEERLRTKVDSDPDMRARWSPAWPQVAAAKNAEQAFAERRALIDRVLNASRLMHHASTLVRLSEELGKPNDQRLKEFGDAHLDSLYLDLYSPEPIYDALEVFMLESTIGRCAERFGADDPTVGIMLGGKSPRARAEELVHGCTLRDPAARKLIMQGRPDPAQQIAHSEDPMIQLARKLDPEARELRKRYEDTVESPLRDAYANIAAARFAAFGDSVYPDATFTLRLAFGPVKGFTDSEEKVPAFTTFAGLYQRAAERKGQEGFTLPAKWIAAKDKLHPDTPFNLVCTADIIGGNSGSPIVNTKGEVVGLIFDGNIYSLVGDFVYDDTKNRAVGVDSRAMIEAIRTVYGAEGLANELTGR